MLLLKTFIFLQNTYHLLFTKKERKTAFLVENYTQTGRFQQNMLVKFPYSALINPFYKIILR
jgi:hypothetical protein